MVDIKRGAEPEGFRQNAEHTLFVEGGNDNAIDPEVLKLLLKNIPIQIKAMGPSSHIRSVAEALHKHHPHYYFLVDRDHHHTQMVEKCWESFPSPDTCNLLIWRRKELENYFLIPDYLSKCDYMQVEEDELQQFILQEASRRVYLDAANMVIIGLREDLKKQWIKIFSNTQLFTSKDAALNQLLTCAEFPQHVSHVSKKLHKDEIVQRFETILQLFFGGQKALAYSHGSWLEMISGKEILNSVINHCFQVKGVRRILQGDEARKEVIKDLLRLPLNEQPDDFQELHSLISKQTISPPTYF